MLKVLRKPPKNPQGRREKYPHRCRHDAKPSEVKNLSMYSPGFTEQQAQRYKTSDGSLGPEAYEFLAAARYRQPANPNRSNFHAKMSRMPKVVVGAVQLSVSVGPYSKIATAGANRMAGAPDGY